MFARIYSNSEWITARFISKITTVQIKYSWILISFKILTFISEKKIFFFMMKKYKNSENCYKFYD
jgi:hypothetical protein